MNTLAQVRRPPATSRTATRSNPNHDSNLSSVARMMFTFSVGFFGPSENPLLPRWIRSPSPRRAGSHHGERQGSRLHGTYGGPRGGFRSRRLRGAATGRAD